MLWRLKFLLMLNLVAMCAFLRVRVCMRAYTRVCYVTVRNAFSRLKEGVIYKNFMQPESSYAKRARVTNASISISHFALGETKVKKGKVCGKLVLQERFRDTIGSSIGLASGLTNHRLG